MFLIQSSSLPYENQTMTLDAIEELGIGWEDFGVIPFVEEITNAKDQYNEPVVLLGSCKAVRLAENYPQMNPGIFFNHETFTVNAWVEGLGEMMLNHDTEVTTFGELLEGFDGDVFIRPITDLKLFTGAVFNFEELVEWWSHNKTRSDNPALNMVETTEITKSTAKNIIGEWRCFSVNGKVISGSQYRINGRTNHNESFPNEVKEYAELALSKWRPHDVVVVDIAQLPDNSFRVIEFNCLNASGWYKADRVAVLNAVHNYALENYNGC